MPVPATPIGIRLEQIRKASQGSKYSFVRWDGDYTNAQSRFIYLCPDHGECVTTISRFLQGSRCKLCAIEKKAAELRSHPDAIERSIADKLTGSKYKFERWVSVYKNNFSRFVYSCPDHGSQEAIYSNFLSHGIQCKMCWRDKKQHHRRVPMEEREKQLIQAMSGSAYTFSKWVDWRGNGESVFEYVCPAHGPQKAGINNFLSRGTRCPSCANFGFDPNKRGFVYALISEDGAFVKVGISNTPETRISSLRGYTPFQFHVAEVKEMPNGYDAKALEARVHAKYRRAGLNGFNGATEWLIFDANILDELR